MVYGGKRWEKKRVAVMSLCEPDGQVIPVSLIWDNGRIFNMILIENRCMKPTEHIGEYAQDYYVAFGREKRHLYKDQYGWFIEVPNKSRENTGQWPPNLEWDPEA